jgi:hypothetical protein
MLLSLAAKETKFALRVRVIHFKDLTAHFHGHKEIVNQTN